MHYYKYLHSNRVIESEQPRPDLLEWAYWSEIDAPAKEPTREPVREPAPEPSAGGQAEPEPDAEPAAEPKPVAKRTRRAATKE
ncbi:hypothetical protein [Nocardia sp. NPDC004860]|uniref:hypothetical protein n=1 Tax=Nocardia sp. NPDC004860 TaxID=3154557 RepID=UPI0033AC673C